MTAQGSGTSVYETVPGCVQYPEILFLKTSFFIV